ncbi:MAG: hypothetical protein ACHQHN_14560 [Sphingobacteriales bacterium]
MKRILFFLLVAGSVVACKKSSQNPVVSLNITGKWELHRRYGGNIIPADTTYQAGNGNIYQFNSDNTYKSYQNGALTQQGTYQVKLYNNGYGMQQMSYYELDLGNNSFVYLIRVNGGTLTLSPVMPDIGTTEYNKLAN